MSVAEGEAEGCFDCAVGTTAEEDGGAETDMTAAAAAAAAATAAACSRATGLDLKI